MARQEVLHNHTSSPIIQYVGFSESAPDYHLFQCTRIRQPLTREELVPLDRRVFGYKSKGRQGGCSRRTCPGEAVVMNKQGTKAYCEMHCSGQPQPCPWTSIFGCVERMELNKGLPSHKHQHCPICRL